MTVRGLAERVYARFDEEGIRYCLLRDDPLAELPAGRAELDVLVAPDQAAQLAEVLAALGFAELPARGHRPHRFFVAYDAATDGWLKLDVVDAIAYGTPVHALRTDWAAGVLHRRQRRGLAHVPAAEDALVTLLLHCLLDKQSFPERHRAVLAALCGQVRDETLVRAQLSALGRPELAWPQLAEQVQGGRWAELAALAPALRAHLVDRDPVGVAARTFWHRMDRRIGRLAQLARPRPPTVALLAPDGAGKSTLAEGLTRSLFVPARMVYMGYYQRGAAPRTAGPRRAKGLGAAARLARQWGRYLRARWYRGRGQVVIFDRYGYDLNLPGTRREHGLRRWRNWALAHACPAPDLVLLLDAPGEVLYARKGEHDPEHLERQRQGYLALQARLPQLVVLDATQDADTVRRMATAWTWSCYADPHRLRRTRRPAAVAPRLSPAPGARVEEEPC